MKKLILLVLACTAIVMTNCTPAAPITPTPAAPAPVAPTTSMTATEAMLVGDWIFDKQESYSSGSLLQTITTSSMTTGGTSFSFTVYAGAHMVFKSSFFNNTVNTPSQPQYYNADYYSSTAGSLIWQVRPTASGETLFYGGGIAPFSSAGSATPYIINLNATTLVCQAWMPGTIPNGYKTYYHK